MSEMTKEHANKETTFTGWIVNSNTITTALTCAICMVIFAVCFRPTTSGGDGGGYDPSYMDGLLKKLAKMEGRIDALSKAWNEANQNCVNGVRLGEDSTTQQPLVYFNAKMMPHKTVTEGNIFIFETVTEIVGGGYDSNTGIFRATVPGLYFFSVTVASEKKGEHVHPILFKNGIEIGRTFAGTEASEWPASGSIAKLVYLEENDQVYVKQLSGRTANVYGKSFSSFAGGLLFFRKQE